MDEIVSTELGTIIAAAIDELHQARRERTRPILAELQTLVSNGPYTYASQCRLVTERLRVCLEAGFWREVQ